jgi:hypothetical protein
MIDLWQVEQKTLSHTSPLAGEAGRGVPRTSPYR